MEGLFLASLASQLMVFVLPLAPSWMNRVTGGCQITLAPSAGAGGNCGSCWKQKVQGVIGLLVSLSLRSRITEHLKLEGTHKDYPSLPLSHNYFFSPSSWVEERGQIKILF